MVVAVAMLAAVGLLAPAAGGAESSAELRERIAEAEATLSQHGHRAQEVQEELTEVEEQIPDARSAYEDADRRLTDAEQRLTQLEAELAAAHEAADAAVAELSRTHRRFATAVDHLASIEAQLELERDSLDHQAAAFYKYGTTTANRSLLASFSTSSSVSELSHNAHLAGAAGDHQARIVERIAALEAAAARERDRLGVLEEQHRSASARAAEALDTVTSLTAEQRGLVAELETVRAERQAAFAELQADADAARSAVQELEQESAAIEGQLRDLAAAERSAREEEERARLEEERRRQEQAQADDGPDASSEDAPPASGSSIRPMTWPANGPVTSPFGYRTHPISGERKLHAGIDIGASNGSTIVAAAGGTVVYAGWYSGYGIAAIINHGDGIATLYAHMSSVSVSTGQSIGRGQRVGAVGSTGYSTGPHLHFEVRKDGTPVDPMPWFR